MLKKSTIEYLESMFPYTAKEKRLNRRTGRTNNRPTLRCYLNRTTVSHRGFEMFYSLHQTWDDYEQKYDNVYTEIISNITATTLSELKTKVDYEVYDKPAIEKI